MTRHPPARTTRLEPRSRRDARWRRLAPWVVAAGVAASGHLILGCPRTGEPTPSGEARPLGDCWVLFDVRQAGTGNAVAAVVWSPEHPDDFETLLPPSEGAPGRFYGVGRLAAGGYALPFAAGDDVVLRVWSQGHEMEEVRVHLRRGANNVPVTVRASAIDDDRVPERIRTEAFDLPTEGPRSGS